MDIVTGTTRPIHSRVPRHIMASVECLIWSSFLRSMATTHRTLPHCRIHYSAGAVESKAVCESVTAYTSYSLELIEKIHLQKKV
jgi:hypothetical protein